MQRQFTTDIDYARNNKRDFLESTRAPSKLTLKQALVALGIIGAVSSLNPDTPNEASNLSTQRAPQQTTPLNTYTVWKKDGTGCLSDGTNTYWLFTDYAGNARHNNPINSSRDFLKFIQRTSTLTLTSGQIQKYDQAWAAANSPLVKQILSNANQNSLPTKVEFFYKLQPANISNGNLFYGPFPVTVEGGCNPPARKTLTAALTTLATYR